MNNFCTLEVPFKYLKSQCTQIFGLVRELVKPKFESAGLPSSPLASSMGTPLSRRHVIVGSGEPVAAHLSVTLLPSRTTMSVLVG